MDKSLPFLVRRGGKRGPAARVTSIRIFAIQAIWEITMATSRDDFGKILVRRGIISRDQLNEAEQMAREQSANVADCLVKLGYATGEEVMRAMAEFHGMEFVDLTEFKIPEEVIELVPESVARENAALPLSQEDDSLKVAISDPFDIETIEKLRFILNRKVETALAPREAILEAINRYYGQVEGESADSMLQEFTDTAIDFTETEDSDAATSDVVDENSAPVVRLVHVMIQEAVQLRASDIHVEPFEDRIRIRYRIDGVLDRTRQPPPTVAGCHPLAYQDSVQAGYRRTATPPGRADQGHRRRERTRPPRERDPHQPRPVRGDATAR